MYINNLRSDIINNCLFCKIIRDEVSNYTLYEDEIFKVFLDINPSTNGDCLIVTKKHILNIYDIDNTTFKHLLDVERKIFDLLKEKLNCIGMTIIQNNEYGQEVKHFHVHMTPRYKDDKLKHVYDSNGLIKLDDIYKTIKPLS